jgi:hypothetical protein
VTADGRRLRGRRALYEDSIALNRRLGNDRMVAVEQSNFAWVETGPHGALGQATRSLASIKTNPFSITTTRFHPKA